MTPVLLTHGYFLAEAAGREGKPVLPEMRWENPLLRSGLALAAANRRAAVAEGLLTARDVGRFVDVEHGHLS